VLKQALNPRYTFKEVSREAASLGLKLNPEQDWPFFKPLRAQFDELSDSGFDANNPAASVYQTAIQATQLSPETARDRENLPRWFYRGQRRHEWTVTPTLFRGLADVGPQIQLQVMTERLTRLRGCVHAIRSMNPGVADPEGVAIAQHYSAELRVSTWLTDVTLSPFVALFFASDGGRAGEVGVIYTIERTEWLSFGGARNTLLGQLRYISPQGIARIDSQRAFFIDAPHPLLYDQLANRALYFRQSEGVTFEDTGLTPPVSRQHIYPASDPTIKHLPTEWSQREGPPLEGEPHEGSIQPLHSLAFYSIAEPWMPNRTPEQEELLLAVCRLHTAMTLRKKHFPDHLVTLHRLRYVCEGIVKANIETAIDLLQLWYLPEIGQSEKKETREAFGACLVEAGISAG
jgi:FRG domain